MSLDRRRGRACSDRRVDERAMEVVRGRQHRGREPFATPAEPPTTTPARAPRPDFSAGRHSRRPSTSVSPGCGRGRRSVRVRARVRGRSEPGGGVIAPLPRAAPAARRRHRLEGARRVAAHRQGVLPPGARMAGGSRHRRAGRSVRLPAARCGGRPGVGPGPGEPFAVRVHQGPWAGRDLLAIGAALPSRLGRTSPCPRRVPPASSWRSSSTSTSATRGRSATSRRRPFGASCRPATTPSNSTD